MARLGGGRSEGRETRRDEGGEGEALKIFGGNDGAHLLKRRHSGNRGESADVPHLSFFSFLFFLFLAVH